MIKCNESCIPTCDFCIYAKHHMFIDEITGLECRGEPESCKKHPEDTRISAAFYCEDFHCFRAGQTVNEQ